MARWVEDAAAVVILWCALAIVAGVTLAQFIHAGTAREPGWPPEWEPEPEPGDDGLYADASAEMDQWWAEHEETTDGNT